MPALDGVRGLAVAAVVAFHFGLDDVRGGLLGVDVFFVLSGYLITGLVLSEWRRHGDVSLRRFWARRARRLLPAMFLVLAAVVVIARFTLDADQLGVVRGDVLATQFYVANWHSVFADHGYFAAFQVPSPLLHMWSLAVEEQFYLLWPLLAVVALRRARSSRWLLAISITGAIGSALLMAGLSLSGVGADRLYYGTDTRAQALFVGDALAGLMFLSGREFTGRSFRPDARRMRRAPRAAIDLLGVVGAAGLVTICLRVDGESLWLYRGGFLLVALCVAAVIAATVLHPHGLLARVLSVRPLTALGLISYGVYLWHWPVAVFLSEARTGLSGGPLLALRTGATLGAAVVSFLLVERPIREQRWQLPRPKVSVPALVGGLAVLAIVVPITTPTHSLDVALASTAARAVRFNPAAVPAEVSVAVAPVTTEPRPMVPAVPNDRPVRVLIVGDSVAASLGSGMAPVDGSPPFVLSNNGYIGCGIARGGETSFRAYTQPGACLTWPERWQGWVDSFHPDVTLVLLGRWEVLDRVHDGQWMHIGEPAFDDYLRSELELATSILTSGGGRVAFLTAPCNDHALADLASPGRLSPDDEARVDRFNQLQSEIVAAHPGWTTLAPLAELLCPGGEYQARISGVPLRSSDGVHFQYLAGRLFVQQLLGPLADWLHAPAST